MKRCPGGVLAREGVEAGALGFTTSRTINHRTSLGEPTPTLKAEADELVGIAKVIGGTGTGVLRAVTDFIDLDAEIELFHRMAAESGRPISVSNRPGADEARRLAYRARPRDRG